MKLNISNKETSIFIPLMKSDDLEREKKNKEKLILEKENLNKKVKEMKQRISQTSIKLGQTERQLDQTKEKLSKLVNEKSNIKIPPMNTQPFKNEYDFMTQKILKNLADEKKEIKKENQDLKEFIKEMNHRIDQLDPNQKSFVFFSF